MKQFLNNDSELLQELKDKKIDASFDIGFTIDTPARFLDIDKELLKQMAEADVGLSLAVYVAAEDD